MPDLVLLSAAQMRRPAPLFPRSRGLRGVDDRRMISGIVYVTRHGLQWKDAPRGYGSHTTYYDRFIRWSRLGVFARVFATLPRSASRPSSGVGFESEPESKADGSDSPREAASPSIGRQ